MTSQATWMLVPFDSGRWAAIGEALTRPIGTVDDLEGCRFALSGDRVSLRGLAALFAAEAGLEARFFGRILPGLQRLALALPGEADAALEPFAPGVSAVRRWRRAEAASWLAHCFFGTLPPRDGKTLPFVDFEVILTAWQPQELAKLRCLVEYFDRIAERPPEGWLTIRRTALPSRTGTEWAADPSPLVPVSVAREGGIGDAEGHLQVDFANRSLGGGVIVEGCVQEEILFAERPELIFAMIVSPLMGPDEAIRVRGAARWARTEGYAHDLAFGGGIDDPTPRDADGTAQKEIVAIDARYFAWRRDLVEQLGPEALARDLQKAWCGFFSHGPDDLAPVATGNWGCGAFGGHPQVKAVLQLLAASATGRALRYYPWHEPGLAGLEGFVDAVSARFGTVGRLWSRLQETGAAIRAAGSLPGGAAPIDLFARLLAD